MSLSFQAETCRSLFVRRLAETRRCLAVALVLLGTLFSSMPTLYAQADDEDEELDQEDIPLIERDPFDRITLDERNRNEVYEIQRLNPSPATKPSTGMLRFRRINAPSLLFEVPWQNVAKFETFPQMVRDEAIRMREDSNLDGSFEYFAFLVSNYPEVPNLDAEINTLLYYDMSALFKAQKFPETLAVLEELYARDPNFRPPGNRTPLKQALDTTLDRLLQGYFEAEDFAAVRALMSRIKKSYGDEQKAVVERWNTKLLDLATLTRDKVNGLIAAGKAREAHNTVRHMLDIMPTIAGGQELRAKVAERFPMVLVGVSQQAFVQDPTRIDYWAAKRAGHLTRRTLLEFASRGEEGGQYISPVGTYEISEDGLQLLLDVGGVAASSAAPQVSAYDVSGRLISLADPNDAEFLPPWNRLVNSVRVEGVDRVVVDLRFPHVLPEAFLRIPIEPPVDGKLPAPDGSYVGMQPENEEVTYDPNPRYEVSGVGNRPKIVERYFADADQAVTALKKGTIDVIDRVFPAELPSLENDPNIIIEPYELPTVHLLIPNQRSPFMEHFSFRRAISYAINREMILNSILLANRAVPGCRTISGPFPAGVSDADPFAYAYNERLSPRPYEPWLAYKLAAIAEMQLKEAAEKKNEKPPAKPELVLAYPAGDISRIACEEIARHLAAVDIQCKLEQLPDGVTTDPDNKYDLLYVELCMWEPLVEARQLFSNQLIRKTTPHIDLALYQLEAAKNWSYARRRLYEMHALSHFDAIVIPLWQIVDHVAYRKQVTGIGDNLLTLYQNAADWRNAPQVVAGNE